MKNKNKQNHIRMRFSTLLFCCLAIVLCSASALHAQITHVPHNETWDIDYPVTGMLQVDGTANLLPGASAQYIYVQNGGTLNMYSGTVGVFISVSPTAGMTVYGTDFAVSNGTIDPDGNWTPDPSGTLTGEYDYYGVKSEINLLILSDIPINLKPPPIEEIQIDIKPDGNHNSINLKSKGVVPVAVFTIAGGLDAGTINPGTVLFAGASPVRWKLCDVDGDGDLDMLFHFKTQELELDENSTEATLTGTADGVGIELTDTVRIVQSKKE